MAAGSTYTPIATTTLGSAAASYTFSSIPSTYTDLVVLIQSIDSNNATPQMQFNNDTATNYSNTSLYGNGTSAESGRNSNTASIYLDDQLTASTTNPSITIINVQNYANTTTYKTAILRDNRNGGTMANVGLWRSNAAINRIDFTRGGGGTFNAGSTFTLYGIAAA
jgi:hypothetical protein